MVAFPSSQRLPGCFLEDFQAKQPARSPSLEGAGQQRVENIYQSKSYLTIGFYIMISLLPIGTYWYQEDMVGRSRALVAQRMDSDPVRKRLASSLLGNMKPISIQQLRLPDLVVLLLVAVMVVVVVVVVVVDLSQEFLWCPPSNMSS